MFANYSNAAEIGGAGLDSQIRAILPLLQMPPLDKKKKKKSKILLSDEAVA